MRLGIFWEVCRSLAKQAQLVVWILAAVTHPATEDLVASGHPIGLPAWISSQEALDLCLQLRRERFIGIERKNPRSGAFVDRRIHLRSVPLPGFGEDVGSELACDVHSFIRRSRVDQDKFIGPGHALKGPPNIGSLVVRQDGNGDFHRENLGVGEVGFNEPLYQRAKRLAGFGQNEAIGGQVELETGIAR